MFSHEIKYVDYNGNEREETLYFNLNAAELAKLQAKTEGGLKDYITKLFSEQDISRIWDLFEKIVLMSYGKKMADGSFAKDEGRIAAKFVETKAYSDFMVWLLSEGGVHATTFINAIVPSEAELNKIAPAQAANVTVLPASN